MITKRTIMLKLDLIQLKIISKRVFNENDGGGTNQDETLQLLEKKIRCTIGLQIWSQPNFPEISIRNKT